MRNYKDGKIYKIVSESTDNIYIGSTTEFLSSVLCNLEYRYNCWKNGKKQNNLTPFEILEKGDYTIELVEEYPCENMDELIARESHWIKKYDGVCINKRHPGRTRKEYYENNKDKFAEIRKRYYDKHKDKFHQYYLNGKDKKMKYYQDRKDIVKQYYTDKKDTILQYRKEYYEENKDKIKQLRKEYYEENKDKIQQYQRDYREKHKKHKENKEKVVKIIDNDKLKDRQKEYREKYKRALIQLIDPDDPEDLSS